MNIEQPARFPLIIFHWFNNIDSCIILNCINWFTRRCIGAFYDVLFLIVVLKNNNLPIVDVVGNSDIFKKPILYSILLFRVFHFNVLHFQPVLQPPLYLEYA